MTKCNKALTHRSFTEVIQAYFKNIEDGHVRAFDDPPLVICFIGVPFISSWVGR